jgi:hypothetical protein
MSTAIDDTDDGARCSRCGLPILRRTAIRYRGKCVPCSRKRWYDPLVTTFFFASMMACLPFFLIRVGITSAGRFVAKYVPGAREHVKAKLNSGWSPDWATVRRIWSSAREVYAGPIGYGAEIKVEYMLLEAVIGNHQIASSLFLREIGTENSILAAYCIEALAFRGEHAILRSIPQEILRSKRQFSLRLGCVGSECTLGEFAQSRSSPTPSLREGTRNPTAHRRN